MISDDSFPLKFGKIFLPQKVSNLHKIQQSRMREEENFYISWPTRKVNKPQQISVLLESRAIFTNFSSWLPAK